MKQPLLIINRSLDETKSNQQSIKQAQTIDNNKKENIIPSSTKKPQPQQASLTIKLSNDHLNDLSNTLLIQ